MARVFSQKYSSTSVGNDGIYSVGENVVEQIWQNSKTDCFAGISQEGPTCETLAKSNCLHPILTLIIPSYARHMHHFVGCLLASYSRKHFSLQFSWVFNLSFSHTQPLQINPTINTGCKRLNIITIKFDTELKPT